MQLEVGLGSPRGFGNLTRLERGSPPYDLKQLPFSILETHLL